MITHHPGHLLEITADDPDTIDRDLNTAVGITSDHAMHSSKGILVTQHGYARYTVAVAGDIPCGQIQERRDWTSADG